MRKRNTNIAVISHRQFQSLSDTLLLRIKVSFMSKSEVHVIGEPNDIKTIQGMPA